MDTWPQRDAFATKLKEHQKATGKNQAEVAADLGMSLSGLRQILYQKTRRASFATCQKAAALFGCSVTEFIDDPGSAPGGIDLSAISPNDRFRCERAFKILTVEDLTDSQHQMLLAELEATLARIRAMKAELS